MFTWWHDLRIRHWARRDVRRYGRRDFVCEHGMVTLHDNVDGGFFHVADGRTCRDR